LALKKVRKHICTKIARVKSWWNWPLGPQIAILRPATKIKISKYKKWQVFLHVLGSWLGVNAACKTFQNVAVEDIWVWDTGLTSWSIYLTLIIFSDSGNYLLQGNLNNTWDLWGGGKGWKNVALLSCSRKWKVIFWFILTPTLISLKNSY